MGLVNNSNVLLQLRDYIIIIILSISKTKKMLMFAFILTECSFFRHESTVSEVDHRGFDVSSTIVSKNVANTRSQY